MLKKVFGSAVFGVEATTITVEVNIDKGIGYHLVGLPDNAIKESSYRIAAALKNNNYQLPVKKITASARNMNRNHIPFIFYSLSNETFMPFRVPDYSFISSWN